VERWQIIAGAGAAAIGAALLAKKKLEEAPPADGALSVKKGGALTSEQARAQQLIPAAQRALEALQDDLAARGVRTYVGSTRRNPEEQAKIVAKGNSATKHSWHLLGRGVDLYPYDPSTGKPDLDGRRLELFKLMHDVSARYGWTGLAFNPDGSKRLITTTKNGKSVKIWDGGHLQFTEGMSFAVAEARDNAKGGVG
jgi:hypothetical protein